MGYKTALLVNGVTLESLQKSNLGADVVLHTLRYPGWPGSVNILSKYLLSWDPFMSVLVTGGDDIFPDENHTAKTLLADFSDHFGSEDAYGVMQPTGDDLGYKERVEDKICASPWMGREWLLASYGGRGPLWDEYYHFFADEELKNVAERQGVLWQRRDVTQRHEHWSRKGGPPKESYQEALDAHWNRDQAIFNRRKNSDFLNNFPLVRIRR